MSAPEIAADLHPAHHRLEALRAAVEAGDYAEAGACMQAYDRCLREAVIAGELDREQIETLLEAQRGILKRFVAMRDKAADDLRGLRQGGRAARAYLQAG
ncbi:hypothetical protein [Coralloluteibacterium stylophorae]|uniref:Flagellar protein FliT n=1 Tax=Coralloluteibacterium stylophorae TaxID=1776034 RepID=A0A8J7VVW0_9GAMM|nr:hypothetical protein [Coralloluteibacterium stylophorae]MBS7457208.1 hypothetical protein [Coralloluteibacterium stylophorae]